MEETLKITRTGESEVIIKKSRFLSSAINVESEEQAREMIAAIRKEHYSARHVCYAYSIGDKNPVLKFSDDGEPGGTAGKPMLDVVLNSGISDILIVVVRYFGGVLLGTGGLVRAYSEAAVQAVKNAETKAICLSRIYDIVLDYGDFDKVKYLIENHDGTAYEVEYSDKVLIRLTVPDKNAEILEKQISEKTAGRSEIKYIETKMV
ncbi:MAG: YigZ family protein [Eubacterium sp.]|nr:YigZ family protein [Eubacterium sp.]